MAKTLLETLQESTNAAPELAPGNEQEQAQNVLLTKATGMSGISDSGPKASSQASKLGLQAGKQEMEKASLAGRLQDLGQIETAKAQEAQLARGEEEFKNQMARMDTVFQRRSKDLLQELGRSQQELSFKDRSSKLEELTQNMRLANKKYIDDLETAGNKARLTDSLTAKEQIARTQMRDSLAFLNDNNAYKKMMNADDREWKMAQANMSVEMAQELARQALNQTNKQAKYESAGNMFSSGAGAYSKYDTYQRESAAEERAAKAEAAADKLKAEQEDIEMDKSAAETGVSG